MSSNSSFITKIRNWSADFMSLDRSEQKFGENAIEQLQGRSRAVYDSKIYAVFASGLFLGLALTCFYGGTISNCLTCVVGIVAVVNLKEAILQHLANKKDIERFREAAKQEVQKQHGINVCDCENHLIVYTQYNSQNWLSDQFVKLRKQLKCN